MKKVKNSVGNFSLLDVVFIVIIFSLLSVAITIFIFRKINRSSATSDIDKVYNQIVDSYYEEVNQEELKESAIDGMMNYLGEKYSIYLDKDSTDYLNNELDGKYKGIGIISSYSNGKVFVEDVFKNSPADISGLQVGDQILSYDGIKITNENTLNDMVDYIKSHNEVSFSIRRESGDVVINVSTTDIDNPVVSSRLFSDDNNNIGYIYLESFTGNSYVQFRNALDELEKNNLKGLIIDLRSNKGGYLEQAESISSMFLSKGKIAYYMKDKNEETIFYDKTDEKRTYPVVVLVNSLTASASEMLAMSLKESYGAILVGTQTYGKGKIQQTSNVGTSSMIKYTTATWYSPNHNCIDGVGIKPSYTAVLTKDYYYNPIDANDSQLTKGLSVLVELLK